MRKNTTLEGVQIVKLETDHFLSDKWAYEVSCFDCGEGTYARTYDIAERWGSKHLRMGCLKPVPGNMPEWI